MSRLPPPPVDWDEQTRLVRAGAACAPTVRTVMPPIQRGSTVLLDRAADLYDHSRPTYGRAGLAAQTALSEALAEMEGAVGVRLFPSGLAAITGALLALLKGGDHVLVADCVYGPTRRFCDNVLRRFGVTVRYFDPALEAEAVLALAGDKTRVIMLESPGSITFEMQDVPAIARLAQSHGILTVIDNTWAAGLLFKPLEHGVDVSVQALTKYVGGHSDVFMGSAAAANPAILAQLDRGVWDMGWAVSPDDAYAMLRGLRTLSVRLGRQGASALAIARWLRDQPEVSAVLCPALPGAPGHELWARDFSGANGLLGLVLRPAPEVAVNTFLDALKLFGLGFSWGGFESLAIPCDQQLNVRSFPPALAGPLVRLQIGLEAPADLILDLRAALDVLNGDAHS